jgi:hypothetical protein
VTATAGYLAKLRDTSVEEMERLLVHNAARLFNW